MPTLTDGPQAPALPGPHYWVMALLALPFGTAAMTYAVAATVGGESSVPGFIAFWVFVALSGVLLAYEDSVRCMSPWRRAVWVVIGCVLITAVVEVGYLVLLYYYYGDWG